MIRKVLFATTAALALVGLTAAPSSAQYEPDVASLTVDQAQVAQGDCFTVSGTDFDANTTYQLGAVYLGDAVARQSPDDGTAVDRGEVTTDDDGAFSRLLVAERDSELGFYLIGVVNPDPEGDPLATVTIEVIAGDGTSNCPTDIAAPDDNNGDQGNQGNQGNQPGANNGTLPRTGSSTLPLVGAGLGLLATGGGLLLLNKRRSIA